MPASDADLLRVTAERLTFGPDAIAHHDGQVVFVPLAAPGDELRVRVTRRERDYLRAEITALDRPGGARVAPACPAFGRCGGCQWQHVGLDAQRAAKQAIVGEQMARLGGFHDADVRPIRAAPEGLAYRTRITLVAEGRRLGYHRRASHVLEEIPRCPIADPAIDAHLDAARAWVAALRAPVDRVTVAAVPGGVVLGATLRRAPSPADEAATERLLAARASVRGAVLVHAATRVCIGDPTMRLELEPGLVLEVGADAFTQVNAAANRLLVAAVVELAGGLSGAAVLDLYCGAGNLSLPLARRGASVTGIEQDGVAVDAARANAARLSLPARFVVGDVAATLATLEPPVDLIVLDPPRAGAAAAVEAIAALAPPRIVYVSCDPATLARDLRAFAAHGYALRAAQPIDVFPQTFHVETVALVELT